MQGGSMAGRQFMRRGPVKAVGRCQCGHEPTLGHARSLSEYGLRGCCFMPGSVGSVTGRHAWSPENCITVRPLLRMAVITGKIPVMSEVDKKAGCERSGAAMGWRVS
jgi:hypothetical protein